MLSIAMYLAPLTTVLAVLQAVSAVFRARFAAWVLLRKRGHSVVVGAGPAAFVLARRLAATRPTVLVGSRIGSDVASRDAVRVVDGDPTDEATLRAAGVRGAARVFALDNSGAVTASSFCLGQRSGLADALEQRLFDDVQGRLAVFGVLDAACDPALLERGALVEQLARAVHARYLVEYAGSSPAQDSHVPWEQLDERYRADNRAQAEHIGTKLAEIDAVIVPAAPDLPPFTLAEGPQGDVEKLARMEHDRWMAARKQAGVTYGEERTARTHPDMLDWDAGLSENAKEKDRMFVRGLPTLLEVEGLAIVRIPGVALGI
jgi:hypothetical protein